MVVYGAKTLQLNSLLEDLIYVSLQTRQNTLMLSKYLRGTIPNVGVRERREVSFVAICFSVV